MQKSGMRVKRLAGGMISIDMNKLEKAIAVMTYIGLYTAHKLLIAGTVILFIVAAASGGDGKFNDGNVKMVAISALFAAVCALAAKVVSLLMKTMETNCKKRYGRK